MQCNFVPEPTGAECTPFMRAKENVTAKTGYAGGTGEGLACYHHSGDKKDGTLYEDLGHSEVVQVRVVVATTQTHSTH